jgi:hypothetical protein
MGAWGGAALMDIKNYQVDVEYTNLSAIGMGLLYFYTRY